MSTRLQALIAREEPAQKGAPPWMVTFGDMMTLLLCFFVLLLSFSTMESERFKLVAGHIREAFGVESRRQFSEVPSGTSVVKSQSGAAVPGQELLFEQIVELIHEKKLDSMIEVSIDDDGLRIVLREELGFEAESATLGDSATPFLDELAALITEYGALAEIGGHCDEKARPGRFASLWELSAARAAAVAERLAAVGVPGDRLLATGFASTRPVAENVSEEGRYQNRRIEIVLRTP